MFPEPKFDLEVVINPLDPLELFGANDASGRMCSCPICKSQALTTLAELSLTPEPEDGSDYIVPDVQIGATGIVMPGTHQLARWFRVPTVPKATKSKYHRQAKTDAKHHSIFSFLSAFSFQSVFFSPCPCTLLIALTIAIFAWYRSFSNLKKVAIKEDRGLELEIDVRMHAYKARTSAWEKLYYCSGCGMVHDRDGKRSLPWYSMLQLVHYPEQEFHKLAVPAVPSVVKPATAEPIRAAQVA